MPEFLCTCHHSQVTIKPSAFKNTKIVSPVIQEAKISVRNNYPAEPPLVYFLHDVKQCLFKEYACLLYTTLQKLPLPNHQSRTVVSQNHPRSTCQNVTSVFLKILKAIKKLNLSSYAHLQIVFLNRHHFLMEVLPSSSCQAHTRHHNQTRVFGDQCSAFRSYDFGWDLPWTFLPHLRFLQRNRHRVSAKK